MSDESLDREKGRKRNDSVRGERREKTEKIERMREKRREKSWKSDGAHKREQPM